MINNKNQDHQKKIHFYKLIRKICYLDLKNYLVILNQVSCLLRILTNFFLYGTCGNGQMPKTVGQVLVMSTASFGFFGDDLGITWASFGDDLITLFVISIVCVSEKTKISRPLPIPRSNGCERRWRLTVTGETCAWRSDKILQQRRLQVSWKSVQLSSV